MVDQTLHQSHRQRELSLDKDESPHVRKILVSTTDDIEYIESKMDSNECRDLSG
jgi:hypothetical protein